MRLDSANSPVMAPMSQTSSSSNPAARSRIAKDLAAGYRLLRNA